MIWPKFLDDDGTPVEKGIPLIGTYKAQMHILVKEMMSYHRNRISVGVNFNSHEGARIVARGIVTKLRAISHDSN